RLVRRPGAAAGRARTGGGDRFGARPGVGCGGDFGALGQGVGPGRPGDLLPVQKGRRWYSRQQEKTHMNMTAANRKVPLLDLKTLHRPVRDEILAEVARV